MKSNSVTGNSTDTRKVDLLLELVFLFLVGLLYGRDLVLPSSSLTQNSRDLLSLFAIFLTGIAEWLLAYLLGFRETVRLWTASLAMMCGGLAILISQGPISSALAFAFFFLSLALLFLACKRQHALWGVLAAGSIVAVLTLGGLDFSIYMVPTAALVAISLSLRVKSDVSRIEVERASARIIGVTALAALVMVSLWVLLGPSLASSLNSDTALAQSSVCRAPPNWVLTSLFIPDPDFYQLAWQVNGAVTGRLYSFIGLIPVLALGFLAAAFLRGTRKYILTFFILSAFGLFVGVGRGSLLDLTDSLSGYLLPECSNGRIALVSLSVITLSGISAEFLSSSINRLRSHFEVELTRRNGRGLGATAGCYRIQVRWLVGLALVAILVASAREVYSTNRGLLSHAPPSIGRSP